jgi:nitrite reductase/ring-hydroxylating ferredoxin subunit
LNRIRIYDAESFEDLFVGQQIRVFQLPDTKVCVGKYGGKFYAFEYLCPHQKHPLKTSKITSFGEVVCPLHEYRFSLEDGREVNNKCEHLKCYKLYINDKGVYLSL